jgi:hypothetical protein
MGSKAQLGHSWRVHADLIKDALWNGGKLPTKMNLGGLARDPGS